MYNEARGVASIGRIEFIYKSQKLKFPSNSDKSSFRNCYLEIYNWLFDNNYDFENVKNVYNNNGNFYTISDVDKIIKSGRYQRRLFQKLKNSDKYILVAGNKSQYKENLNNMLTDFGITGKIKFDGFDGIDIDYFDEENIEVKPFSRFKTFDIESELTKAQAQSEDDVKPFNKFKATRSQEEIESKDFSKNPFRQAICVLGGSGAGKSTTIENILDKEGHEFEFIIPSSSTTTLLSQFSPSKSGYIPSKLGKMIVNAYNNPTQLFTAVFDECHKSNVIEMINDEILQAISTKRYAGRRFISLDDDTAELYPGTEKHRGNILMPDNLGFIFISSKPDVIIHNDDFFNRLEIVQLKSYEEERLTNIEQLLSKTLSNEEKESLKSNND